MGQRHDPKQFDKLKSVISEIRGPCQWTKGLTLIFCLKKKMTFTNYKYKLFINIIRIIKNNIIKLTKKGNKGLTYWFHNFFYLISKSAEDMEYYKLYSCRILMVG